MAEKELKPCPFCGGRAEIQERVDGDAVYVGCTKCGITTGDICIRADYCANDRAVETRNERSYNENVCARFLPNNGDDLCVNDSGASGCKCHGQIDNCDFYDEGGFLYE